MENGNGNGNGLHIVMFPFLAFGHISLFIQLSRKLNTVDPTVRITFLTTPANVPRIASLPSYSYSSQQRPASMIIIHSLPLPPGAESTAELTMAQAQLLINAVDAMKPDVQALLSRLTPHFVVFDFAMPWIPSVATPLGIKPLFFTVFAVIATAYLTVPSRRPLGTRAPSIHDLKKPPPGFPPTSTVAVAGGIPTYQAQDLIYIFKTFDDGKPCVYDRVTACINDCSTIIFKTCTEMEGQYISYCESEYKKPMLLAGPVVPEPPSGDELQHRWAAWLDKFEEGSVIYCSFGSETFLNDKATKELLLGLEMTKLPFFVVLNCPQGEEMRKKLPKGFESRVRERGDSSGLGAATAHTVP